MSDDDEARATGLRRDGDGDALGARSARDRALVASVAAALVSRAVGVIATLINIGLAARSLSPSELGVVTVLSALLAYFNFGDFGMGSVVMTRLPPAHARGDLAEVRTIISSALSAMLIVGTVAVAIGIGSAWFLPWQDLLGADAVAESEIRRTVIVFVVTGAIGIVGSVGSRVLAAMQRGALIRVSESIAAVTSVLGVIVCARVDAPIWTYLLALFAPYTVSWLAQLAYIMVRYPYMKTSPKDLDFGVGLRFLVDGVAFAILSAGWVLAYTLDSFVVASVLGASSAAVFSIAVRLFGLVGTTLSLAGQQMWPAMGESIARGDMAWVRKRFRHSIITSAVVSSITCAVLVAIGPSFARVWVGDDLVPPQSVFIALGVWTIYQTVIVQYSLMLLAADKIRLLAALGVVVAVVNLTVSIILTRQIGMVGPVIGNLVAACSIQLVPMILMTRGFMRQTLRSAPESLPGIDGPHPAPRDE